MQNFLTDVAILAIGIYTTFNLAGWSLDYLRRKLPGDRLVLPLLGGFWAGVMYLLVVGFTDDLLLEVPLLKRAQEGLIVGLSTAFAKVLIDYIAVRLGVDPPRGERASQPQKDPVAR